MGKNKLYFVGNAHLDPVWQWQWQEGSAEAKATVRSALDRMKEYPDFRFVCSSASVYRWIEEFDPDMFEEIRQRVREGRFIIVGGMHVQPDCNNPSGEGFARQTLYAQRYFAEKFGTTAKVAYNVDSFGHNAMLPQIFRKSGMTRYIFMRPGPHEKDMPHDLFRWRAPDGSEVTTYRILDPYCCNFKTAEELENRLAYLEENSKTDISALPVFYGVGNHGGGPTKTNLDLIAAYGKSHPGVEIRYSDLTDFFDEAEKGELPLHCDDLQHHAAGCYATVSHLKNGIRRGECELSAAEAYAVLAGKLCGKKYPAEKLADAWRNICFLHFHDSMGGCSIEAVHEDSRYMYGSALEAAAVAENNALQTLSWAVDTSDSGKGLPVFVFNPHGFPVTQAVQVNKAAASVADSEGCPVPSQQVYSPTEPCMQRTDTLFMAHVPALGYAVYYLGDKPDETQPGAWAEDCAKPLSAGDRSGVVLENEHYRIEFERYSGYIISFADKQTGREIITGRAAVPTVMDEYYHDTWSHGKNFFTDQMARFSDARVTVTERGPLRATVKVVSRYNDSTLTQWFSLVRGEKQLRMKAEVDWHEKHKMLKLAWPMAVENARACYEIPFGKIYRPADGEEEPGLMWTAAVDGEDRGFALVNSDTYSSGVLGGTLYQTVLRSPAYGDHGGPRTDACRYTEQGSRVFRCILMPVEGAFAPVIRTAKVLNKPLTNIVENWHSGKIVQKVYGGLSVSADNVILSALKRSEDGKGLVVRLYETEGRDTPVTVSGGLMPIPLQAVFTPYSVNTYYLADGGTQWKEVLLTEFDM